MLIYQYPPLVPGVLIKRYKRFLADIQLDSGEVITAHCANTGPMIGVCTPGSPVQVSKSDNIDRKLAYTWEMIQVDHTWVGINTALPNRVVKLLLEKQLFPELVYNYIKPEVKYGADSRIDFLLTSSNLTDVPIYLEVKNTTLAESDLALFPDTVTTRGQKHLQELTAVLSYAKSVMLYFISRSDCLRFCPADSYDPLYGELLRQGIARGMIVLPCRFEITPFEINFLGLAELAL